MAAEQTNVQTAQVPAAKVRMKEQNLPSFIPKASLFIMDVFQRSTGIIKRLIGLVGQ
jgi:hypothetical protein